MCATEQTAPLLLRKVIETVLLGRPSESPAGAGDWRRAMAWCLVRD